MDFDKTKDAYLNSVVKELLDNCVYIDRLNQSADDPNKLINWGVEDLDYDINKCSSYCVKIYNSYNQVYEPVLCFSCENILMSRFSLQSIIKNHLQSQKEIHAELQTIKEELQHLRQCLGTMYRDCYN